MNEKKLNLKNKNISEAIKLIRQNNKLSQREFAKKVEVSNALISRVEDESVKRPKLEFIMKVSQVFNVPYIELAKCAGYEFSINDSLARLELATGLNEKFLKKYISLDKENFEENTDYIDIEKILKSFEKKEIDLETTKEMILVMGNLDIFLNSEN